MDCPATCVCRLKKGELINKQMMRIDLYCNTEETYCTGISFVPGSIIDLLLIYGKLEIEDPITITGCKIYCIVYHDCVPYIYDDDSNIRLHVYPRHYQCDLRRFFKYPIDLVLLGSIDFEKLDSWDLSNMHELTVDVDNYRSREFVQFLAKYPKLKFLYITMNGDKSWGEFIKTIPCRNLEVLDLIPEDGSDCNRYDIKNTLDELITKNPKLTDMPGTLVVYKPETFCGREVYFRPASAYHRYSDTVCQKCLDIYNKNIEAYE